MHIAHCKALRGVPCSTKFSHDMHVRLTQVRNSAVGTNRGAARHSAGVLRALQ